jgi:anti-sigma factor RsiW
MNEHEQFERLLPWLVNGTLAAAERRRLEEHLAACPACREELGQCRRLAEELARCAPPEPAPHPAQLARLVERIRSGGAELGDEIAAARNPRWTPRRVWRATPAAARWLLVAQAAALVAALGLFTWRLRASDAEAFRTLSSPTAPAARADVRVVFAPAASEAEIRSLLLEARAEIVGGPSPLGTYTLALAPAPAGESVAAVVALLRANPRVRLAEPIRPRQEARPGDVARP